MDVCVVTNDKKIARFLLLELEEIGVDVHACENFSMPAQLYICDLDFLPPDTEFPADVIGFSSDPEKSKIVSLFFGRPIDARFIRQTVTKILEETRDMRRARTLAVSMDTRRVFGPYGDVHLSIKELKLFMALKEAGTLTREEAAAFFGDSESNVLDVYMHYLRKKLKTVCQVDIIAAKRRVGYSFRDDVKVNIL